MSVLQASFLSGSNADYIAELYAKFLEDPNSVDSSWTQFFSDMRDDARSLGMELRGASWAPAPTNKIVGNPGNDNVSPPAAKDKGQASGLSAEQVSAATRDSIRALMLIRAYRVMGHMQAKLDPLNLEQPSAVAELDHKFYGFSDRDLDKQIFIDGVLGLNTPTLREIINVLQRTYCAHVGVEFMHLQTPAEKSWIQERIESSNNRTNFSIEQKKYILNSLTRGEGFEKFCQLKFTGTKRFGLEGGEGMIAGLEMILLRGAELGLKEAVFGMAHRGRLNVLTNILNKPFTAMFAEFQGSSAYPDSVQGSGDVKYHMGTSTDRDFGGVTLHLTLNPNPSHLEFVNPVVVGRVRAKQQQRCGTVDVSAEARTQVMGILIHGDAAFAGQGIVPETLMLSELKGYRTGGTIHFVINNQIGFTTAPQYSRSGMYCTDIARSIQAPIFHVNGDDAEAVAHVARLAMEYRQQFHHDVVIDMVSYRRQGHNESDEPAFTQPKMYAAIKKQPTTRELYIKQLAAEGSLSAEAGEQVNTDFMAKLEKDFQAATGYKPNKADWLEGKWAGLQTASSASEDWSAVSNTGVDMAILKEVGMAISKIPADFAMNPKIAKQMEAKRQAIETGEGIDWATAEALAFGTLCVEGTPVRLSGQDCGRGTFSQRHSAIYDQNNETRYIPLNTVRPGKQATFEVHDSPLSECAVLGFDYGFSLVEPNALVMWEGQFGDFSNGAQVIIDQFIASSESKWLRMSGITLLLPHGYEGQGPEHSSARLERYLQLCAEDNWQVANCSTPANYFHILRRQIRRSFRKPLVLMTPKSLLRHKLCVSKLSEMSLMTGFRRIIGETSTDLENDSRIKRVVICSGKVYYDLLQAREDKKLKNVAIIRLEQFYPFPAKPLAEELGKYPYADVIWCQEEPRNQGGWHFVDRRIEEVLTDIRHRSKRPVYVGREDAAAPATGSLKRHNAEQEKLVKEALG